MLGIRVPEPDEVMLISGGRTGEKPFRIARSRKFVMPILNRVGFVALKLREAQVTEPCVTRQGVEISASAVCAFSIADDEESLYNAGKMFLSGQNSIEASVGQIFAGHLREVVGGMTVEEITSEREVLRKNVLEASKDEMGRLGLRVHSFQIQKIGDPSGYIANMRRKAQAQIEQAAKIAEADANQAAAERQQESERKQAEYARDTAIAKAQYDADQAAQTADANQKAAVAQAMADQKIAIAEASRDQASEVANAQAQQEIEAAKARAAQAGPLASAQASKEVKEAETALAHQQAELRQNQLLAEVVRPAEAEAEKTRTLAKAEADAATMKAEAAEAGNRVQLDQRTIELWPQVAKAIASEFSGAHVNILNGGEGLNQLMAGVMAQGMQILASAREAYAETTASQNGRTTADVAVTATH